MQILFRQSVDRWRLGVLFCVLFPASVVAQDLVLSIGSGPAGAGGTAAVAIDMASTTPLAAVQWSFIYPAEIVGLAVVPSTVVLEAQKSVVCKANTCLAYGMNNTSIANGPLAVVTFRLAADATGPSIPIRIVAVSGSSPAGVYIPGSGGEGLISVLPRRTVRPATRPPDPCCPLESSAGAPDAASRPPAAAERRRVPALVPVIADGGIRNAASLPSSVRGEGLGVEGLPVAVGSLVSIFGANFGTSADLVRVTFNGASATVVLVTDTQINAQVPIEILPQPRTESITARVVVTVDRRPSAAKLVRVVRYSPSVFSLAGGSGNAVLHSVVDGSLAAPPPVSAICGCSTRAIHPGEGGIVYVTGLGSPAAAPVVVIGGMEAVVTSFGALSGYPGVDRIEIIVPGEVPVGDRIPVQVRAGGLTSSDQVTVAIGPEG